MLKSAHKAIPTVCLLLVVSLLLTSCGPTNPDLRPEDSKLRDGISLLLKDYYSHHPTDKSWDPNLVDAQIHRKLPIGISTPAGWKLTWSSPLKGELSYVYIPWILTSTYPNHFASDNASYSGGSPVPNSVIQDLTHQVLGNDTYSAAIVDVRYSSTNKKWIVFTSIPYLPVTDNAYGWATVVDGRWKVIDFGTALVGCDKVPTDVQREFGFTCP